MSTREQWRTTARYSESHRKYHTLQHLQECVAQGAPEERFDEYERLCLPQRK